MKTIVFIPDELSRCAALLAKCLKLSRSQFYTKAIEEFVTEHARTDVRAKLDQVYAAEPFKMDPALAGAQSASIGREDW